MYDDSKDTEDPDYEFFLIYIVDRSNILAFRGDVVHAGGANNSDSVTRRIHSYVAIDSTIIPVDNVYILQQQIKKIDKNVVLATPFNISELVSENRTASKFMYAK